MYLCPSSAIVQILHPPAVRDNGRDGEPVWNRAATVSHRIDQLREGSRPEEPRVLHRGRQGQPEGLDGHLRQDHISQGTGRGEAGGRKVHINDKSENGPPRWWIVRDSLSVGLDSTIIFLFQETRYIPSTGSPWPD